MLRFLADLLRGGGFGRDDSKLHSKGSVVVSSAIFSAANSASLFLLAFLLVSSEESVILGTLLLLLRFFGMSFIASMGDSQVTKTEVEGSLVDSQGTFWKDAWLVLQTLPAVWKISR